MCVRQEGLGKRLRQRLIAVHRSGGAVGPDQLTDADVSAGFGCQHAGAVDLSNCLGGRGEQHTLCAGWDCGQNSQRQELRKVMEESHGMAERNSPLPDRVGVFAGIAGVRVFFLPLIRTREKREYIERGCLLPYARTQVLKL